MSIFLPSMWRPDADGGALSSLGSVETPEQQVLCNVDGRQQETHQGCSLAESDLYHFSSSSRE